MARTAARFAGVSLLFLIAILPLRGQSTDPVFEDKKASEWVKIVRDDPSAMPGRRAKSQWPSALLLRIASLCIVVSAGHRAYRGSR